MSLARKQERMTPAAKERAAIVAWVRRLDGVDMTWEYLAARIAEGAHHETAGTLRAERGPCHEKRCKYWKGHIGAHHV